jgi:hypothetical protein
LFAAGEPAAPGQIPFIVLTQDLTAPYQATFSLATPPAAGAAAARALAASDAADAGKTPPAAPPAQKALAGFLALQALFPSSAGSAAGQHLVLQKPIQLPAATASYVWTFGDGQTATTDTPTVTHDYFPAIAPGRVPFAFDVSCRIVQDNITVTRTLVLYSAYGMCQRNGTTVPYVTGDVYATLNSDKTSFSASLIVHNIEATAITINQMAIVPVGNNGSASFPAPSFIKMAKPITVAAHSSNLLGVQALRSQLSSAAKGAAVTGFIVWFEGTLAAPALVAPRQAAKTEAVTLPSIDTALNNVLHPGGPILFPTGAASTVRFSWNVQLQLQDQRLPAPPLVILKLGSDVFATLGKAGAIASPIVRSGGIAVDSATNVASVALTSAAPTPAQAAQVRHSVLSVLNTANSAAGAK